MFNPPAGWPSFKDMLWNQLFKMSFSIYVWKRTAQADLTILSRELSPLDEDCLTPNEAQHPFPKPGLTPNYRYRTLDLTCQWTKQALFTNVSVWLINRQSTLYHVWAIFKYVRQCPSSLRSIGCSFSCNEAMRCNCRRWAAAHRWVQIPLAHSCVRSPHWRSGGERREC